MTIKQTSLFVVVTIVVVVTIFSDKVSAVKFEHNYKNTWGNDHMTILQKEDEEIVRLSVDNTSGAGFESKLRYASGFFQMRMKVPKYKDTTGLVISFYLHSLVDGEPNKPHDELDFEFLGAKKKPWTLQTNIFSMDAGFREQKIKIAWFDPSADFHNYTILWNQHHIVFYVDDIPIREFKNHSDIGVNYPSQWMKSRGSLWDGTPWESGGPPVNWTHAPFLAYYRGFEIDACEFKNLTTKNHCYDDKYWWNQQKFTSLTPKQQKAHDDIRAKHMFYDYCNDTNAGAFKECNITSLSLPPQSYK